MNQQIYSLEAVLISETILYELNALRTSTLGWDESLQTVNRTLNEARKLAQLVLPKDRADHLQKELIF